MHKYFRIKLFFIHTKIRKKESSIGNLFELYIDPKLLRNPFWFCFSINIFFSQRQSQKYVEIIVISFPFVATRVFPFFSFFFFLFFLFFDIWAYVFYSFILLNKSTVSSISFCILPSEQEEKWTTFLFKIYENLVFLSFEFFHT